MANKDQDLFPSHPKPQNPDVNFAPVVDDRQPSGPGEGGYRSSTRKPPWHKEEYSDGGSYYSDARINKKAYEPIKGGAPFQELIFTSPDLEHYYNENYNTVLLTNRDDSPKIDENTGLQQFESGGVPEEYVAAEYIKWAINSHLPEGTLSLPPGYDGTLDIAMVMKRIQNSLRDGTITREDEEFREVLEGVATDHFISERLSAGGFGDGITPYKDSKRGGSPQGVPVAIRSVVQVIPYKKPDINHAKRMGSHLAKFRRDAAHYIEADTGRDPHHPDLELSALDAKEEAKQRKDRIDADHHLQEDRRYFVEQAFKRTPILAKELVRAIDRNTQEDRDNLTDFTGPPPPSKGKELPLMKHTIQYVPMAEEAFDVERYKDAWGYLHRFGDEATFTYDPNKKTLRDGTGVLYVSWDGDLNTGDDITRIHLPNDHEVEIKGTLLYEQAISMRRQLYEVGKSAGHLAVLRSKEPTAPLQLLSPSNGDSEELAPEGYEIRQKSNGEPYLTKKSTAVITF